MPLDGGDLANRAASDQLGDARWPLLYDLELDPGESYNVIDRHPEVAARMEALMTAEEKQKAENPGGWL